FLNNISKTSVICSFMILSSSANKTYLNEEVEIFHPLDTTIEEVDNEIGTIYKKEDGKYYIKFKKIVTESGKELESVHSGNINPIKLPTKLPYLTIFRIETEDFVE
ncbi:MAG: hypothetical protein RBT59_10595, partial [Arcobacteraceae bacterium]|nr:hypothetical protein [Arcobacteraceae bacterium]